MLVGCMLEDKDSEELQLKFLTIEELYKHSIEKDDSSSSRLFNYFISYVELLANTAYSRNKKGKDLVESFLSIDQILAILNENKHILTGLYKTPFIKLLQYAFIDVQDTYLVSREHQ